MILPETTKDCHVAEQAPPIGDQLIAQRRLEGNLKS
jgi:hypothetical protein